MEIIESNLFGVRSAFIRLETKNNEPNFLLFPMVHIADPAFYENVTQRLEQCDIILYEGVNSPTTNLLTSSYHALAGISRLGFVLQNTMDLSHLKNRLIHADVSGDDFEHKWSKLSFFSRIFIPILAPLVGIYMRFFAKRSHVMWVMKVSLKKSDYTVSPYNETIEEIDEVLLGWRDKHLIQVVRKHISDKSIKTIGILFGAEHMRAIIYYLTQRPDPGYNIVHTEWMTVCKP